MHRRRRVRAAWRHVSLGDKCLSRRLTSLNPDLILGIQMAAAEERHQGHQRVGINDGLHMDTLSRCDVC